MPPALNSDGPSIPHRMLHWLFSRRDLIAPQSITVCVTSMLMCVVWFDDVLPCLHAVSPPHHRHRLAPSHFLLFSWLWCFNGLCAPLGSSSSLLSLSTPEFRSPSHGGNLNRSASLSCTERAPECGSVGGSVTQIPGTPFQYIPDFCVRALTDLQFVKVTIPVPVSRWIFTLAAEV